MSIEAANKSRFERGLMKLTELEGELLEALEFAMSQSGMSYRTRIAGQNEGFCDKIDAGRAAIIKAYGTTLP